MICGLTTNNSYAQDTTDHTVGIEQEQAQSQVSEGVHSSVMASDKEEVSQVISNTANYLTKTITEPQVGSIGGEWAIIGLSRSSYPILQSYYELYYKRVEKYVSEHNGILHDKKYSEYSRLVLSLTAIGKDPSNVAGYNLLEPLGDFEKTVWQGLNGPIFALIALDSGKYDIPMNTAAKTQATRELYIEEILARQLEDGGFALSGNVADPDLTGMALQALSKYQDRKHVKAATDKAIEVLSTMQNESGGYSSWGIGNSESTAQVIMALCELGIDLEDSRFVKNGHTLINNLLSYYRKDKGFLHTSDGVGESLMSTEQAFYTLVNIQRIQSGKSSLYNMNDTGANKDKDGYTPSPVVGLANKHKDVKGSDIVNSGKTFSDIQGHFNQQSIEAMAERNIINGKTDQLFAPDQTMTRAEFATIVTKSLGLPLTEKQVFSDVPQDSWYSLYIGTAYQYGIIKGISADTFAPNHTITRQEAAVMIANAAKLSGMDTELTDMEIRDMLSQFSDYTSTATWAREGLAFCYSEHLMSQDMLTIEPKILVKRSEVSEMLYRMLMASKLI